MIFKSPTPYSRHEFGYLFLSIDRRSVVIEMKHIGRKLYHIVGGIGLLSLYYILGREHALMFYAVFFLISLGLDLTRLKIPAVNQFIFTRFGSFIRKNEEHKLTGTAP